MTTEGYIATGIEIARNGGEFYSEKRTQLNRIPYESMNLMVIDIAAYFKAQGIHRDGVEISTRHIKETSMGPILRETKLDDGYFKTTTTNFSDNELKKLTNDVIIALRGM
jgi:hypothetical protein